MLIVLRTMGTPVHVISRGRMRQMTRRSWSLVLSLLLLCWSGGSLFHVEDGPECGPCHCAVCHVARAIAAGAPAAQPVILAHLAVATDTPVEPPAPVAPIEGELEPWAPRGPPPSA